nr:hypothetical protein [Bathymodiolus platifrons methanotrophic gill symbiont]
MKQLTHNEQTPWESHSLTEDIYFNGSGTGVTVGTAPVIITDNTENLFWQIVTQENNLSFYQKYINRYPYGIYSQQAKASIQS